MNKYDIVSLGDINMDLVLANDLGLGFCDLSENGTIVWENIHEVPGGSGLNFCVFAKEFGYSPLLVAKIGSDVYGETMSRWLADNGIDRIRGVSKNHSTGLAIILRDKNGIRFLINNAKNANHELAHEDISEYKDIINNCGVLYVSGYCISNPDSPRFNTTMDILRHSRDVSLGWPVTVLDVVPHRIYDKYSLDEFLAIAEPFDIIFSEVSTIRRLLEVGKKLEVVDRNIAEETIALTEKYFEKIVLRYGESGCDYEVLWNGTGRRLEYHDTGHANVVDKRGFGDKLAIRALKHFFEVLPTP